MEDTRVLTKNTRKEIRKILEYKIHKSFLIYTCRVIHYYYQMYLEASTASVSQYINLILLIFFLTPRLAKENVRNLRDIKSLITDKGKNRLVP